MKCCTAKKKGFLIIAFLSAVVLALSLSMGLTTQAKAAIEDTNLVYPVGSVRRVTEYSVYTARESSTFRIAGNDPHKESYDSLSPQNYGVIGQDGLNYLGLKCITVTFELELWEEADGYQDIYIYLGQEPQPDKDGYQPYRVYKNNEHGGSGKKTQHAKYVFYAELPVGTYFTIAYGAHGALSNVWYNKNLKVKFAVSPDNPKITDIRLLQVNWI